MENKNLFWIAKSGNFIMTSVGNMLSERGYDAKEIEADVTEVGRNKETEGIMIYADESIADMHELLVYIKDISLEENIPVFLFGDEDDISLVKKVLSESNIKLEFKRPVDAASAAAQIDKFLKDNDRHARKKILVIDDSGAMLRNIKGWLEDKYQVVLANSGTMGIKYMSQSRPDLVLLDYEMPIIDGRQVLQMIRSESDFSSIPVIFLTGKNDRESIMKVLELKPEGYLLKTMEPAEIVKAVDDFFEKRKIKW